MYQTIKRLPGFAAYYSFRIASRLLMYLYRPLFKSYGKSFRFEPFGSWFSFKSISVGNDVYIGPGAKLIAQNSFIKIGNKVLFGPDVTIRGGDHNTKIIGKYMYDVHEKLPENDQGVTIHDDVWIGTRAVILKGVEIGRGSVVAANAVVSKSVPPYSIVAGIPAKTIKWRWEIDDIIKHEQALYPPEQRFSRSDLESFRKGFSI
jgi:acetyltransferase-like isoleucine patch superfamily enzyme